jgi:Tol biopolymer transport system component
MEAKTMKAKRTFFVAAVLSLVVFCPPVLAEWTEPVPVTEINSNYQEKSPFLSFDGLTLYFSRIETYGFYGSRMFQATRTTPVGPFTEVKEISTLNYPGGGVEYPWVSPDNLRMYYRYKQPTTRYRMAVTKRESVNDPWQTGTDIAELNALGDVFNPTLNMDGLTIFFAGDKLTGGKGDYDIWVASRPDVNAPFGNVTNAGEINSSAADVHPSISPDGLTLYFASNRNGNYQLFKATRGSLDALFGNVEQLSFFDCPDCSLYYPFLSSDGKAFYFVKSTSEQTLDIYVSYFYTPETDKWSEPVPLTEVNTDYADITPFLSYDGLTLYFCRERTPEFLYSRIYQAARQIPSGPFTQISEISTLNPPHGDVCHPWVSPDNLRMYYWGPNGNLEISKRNSTGDPWPPGIEISELNALGPLYNPALTPDELTIVFMGYKLPGGKGNHDIWMATRPDINSPFGNVRNLTELNTPANDADPFLLPDGLTLYFTSDVNGDCQIYRATRESPDAPFGNIEHLSFFDVPGMDSRFPVLSSDGAAFYFCIVSRVSVATSDIYVSYLSQIPPVPEPNIYYVDGVNGNDNNNGLTLQTAFATIQKGLNTAGNRDTVLVYPALYREGVDFLGKAVTVQGVATSAGVAVIENPGDFAVSFFNGEEPNSILKNFVVQNSFLALFIAGSSPTISNLTIIGNNYGVKCYTGADPAISNCIFWNNTEADLIGCQAQYSWVEDELELLVPPTPVSHWKLDEGSGTIANDTVGTNHGTIHGATWTTGQVNGALIFDGDQDYVSIADSDSLTPGTDITISFWLNNRGGQNAGIYKWASCPDESGSPGNSRAYALQVLNSDKKVDFRVHSGVNTYDDLMSESAFSLNEWHHLAATFHGGDAAIYIDGQLDKAGQMSVSSIMNDAQPLMVGGAWEYCGADSIENKLNGSIDEIMIFGAALSAAQVQHLYQNGAGLDPLFADATSGDYHLRSRRGRYWPEHDVWVLDKVTSPCVDGGDPAVDPSGEPMPNGGRIDIGAYGGTPFASMSDWPIAGDVNRDGVVDLADMAIFCNEWLSALPWAE